MKKLATMFLFLIIGFFFGCSTTQNIVANTEKEVGRNVSENNVETDGVYQKIIDWSGKLDGESSTPSWMKTMKRGNAIAYCNEYGLQSKLNRKWITPSCSESYISYEDGLIAAQANSFAALGEEIATEINSSLSSSITDGQKSNIRRVVTSSINKVTGLSYEGNFWRCVEEKDNHGNKIRKYYVFAFYSMEQNLYQSQLKASLLGILDSKNLSIEEVDAVAAATKQIMDKEKRESEVVEKAKERELERQLKEYETTQKLAEEETKQVRANSVARQSEAKYSAMSSVASEKSAALQTSAANNMTISDARAYLLENF
jgi:hypothetical protein